MNFKVSNNINKKTITVTIKSSFCNISHNSKVSSFLVNIYNLIKVKGLQSLKKLFSKNLMKTVISTFLQNEKP